MESTWVQGMAGVLFGLSLFISGCAEKGREDPVSQSPVEREQPSVAGETGTGEGTAPATPGSEMEQKPGSKEKQERG